HNQTTASTVTEKRDKAYYDEFRAPALAGISAEVNFKNDGTAAVKAQIAPLEDFDNADDRYRLGYLIVADVYDPENVYIYQKNSASSPSWEEFYYMPNRILAKDVFFSNLIVEASTGVHGVAGSLADGKTAHEYELVVPEDYRRFPLKLVAMLIDNSDGRVVNCCFAKDNSTHAAPMILPDEANSAVYDLQGRRVDSQRDIAPGIYIKNRQKYIIK
ncbi:MAG: hypothetical protein HUJ98_01465, partial [Bacteroidaceae bacterium]|nr:hypothetical protein [Bacteroidaceae bacterium]